MLMSQNQNLIGQCTASLYKDVKYVFICFLLPPNIFLLFKKWEDLVS